MADVILKQPNTQDFKDRAKWEQFDTEYTSRQHGVPPGNPYTFRAFPKMLFRAQRVPAGFPRPGTWACSLERPAYFGFRTENEWDRACQFADNFSRDCQRTVSDETELRRARDEGWRESMREALDFQATLDKVVSDAAAERAYQDRNMSEAAKAEVEKAEAAQEWGHMAEKKEAPVRRKPGRPKKNAALTT